MEFKNFDLLIDTTPSARAITAPDGDKLAFVSSETESP
jgi:hypothetical protein